MKTRINIVLGFLILATNIGFGQDSISQVLTTKTIINPKVKGLQFDSDKADIIQIIRNKYSLSKKERKLISDSIFKNPKTKELFQDYKKKINTNILLDKNFQCFHAIINNKKLTYENKRRLLLDKIEYDEKNKAKENVINTKDNFCGTPHSFNPASHQTVKVIRDINSRKLATESYIKEINQANINFSQALLIIDGVVVETNIFLKRNKIKIKKIDLISEKNGPALYGYRGRNGIIIITTKK